MNKKQYNKASLHNTKKQLFKMEWSLGNKVLCTCKNISAATSINIVLTGLITMFEKFEGSGVSKEDRNKLREVIIVSIKEQME